MNLSDDKRYIFNIIVGGISVYSFTQLCKYHIQTYHQKSIIRQAERSKVYTPDEILKKVKDRADIFQENSDFKGFAYANENKSEIKGRIFLNGIIKCDKPIYSAHHFVGDFKMKGMIYNVTYDEEKYSLDQADDTTKEYKTSDFPDNATFQKVKQFQLQDPYSSTQCTVEITDDLDVTRALQLIGQRDKIITASFGQRIIGLVIMLVKLLADLLMGARSPISRSIRGVRLGITEKEVGIKVDTITSVYGEIFYNLETGQLRFKFPEALVNDKNSFIHRLKENMVDSRYLRNFFGIVFAGTALYFGRRAYNYWKNNKQAKKEAIY